MAQGPTNVNLIATHIHNNPGCRRVDLKRMLHKAAYGEDTSEKSKLWCKNQYFQRYGSASNVYLDRLWYNSEDKGHASTSSPQGYWYTGRRGRSHTRTSSYQLTQKGKEKVWPLPTVRPFEAGSLVEWQYNSPKTRSPWKKGWNPVHKALVLECTDLYGLLVMLIGEPIHSDGNRIVHLSHQVWIRKFND